MSFLKSYLAGLLRYGLAGVFGWLIGQGIVTPEQSESFILGLSGAAATAVWLLWIKYRDQALLRIGLALPPGSTIEQAIAIFRNRMFGAKSDDAE